MPPDDNTVTLREYFDARLRDMDIRQQQRFDAQTKAVDSAMTAQRTAIEAALVAADKATGKAEDAAKDRFDSVNEFRGTLTDQAATFITRTEAEAAIQRNTERTQELTVAIRELATKQEVINAYERAENRLQAVEKIIANREGRGTGLDAGWKYLAGFVAVIAAIVAIFIAIHGGR